MGFLNRDLPVIVIEKGFEPIVVVSVLFPLLLLLRSMAIMEILLYNRTASCLSAVADDANATPHIVNESPKVVQKVNVTKVVTQRQIIALI